MVTAVNHPLVQENLTILRNKETSLEDFRKALSTLGLMLFYESMRDEKQKTIKVQTPLEETDGYVLDDQFVLIPILRAGLGMISGIINIIPHAKIGTIGLKRDEQTLKPNVYYLNFPDKMDKHRVFIIDPMLATGGSMVKTLEILDGYNVKDIIIISAIAAPEGIEAVENANPNVKIYTASVDRQLNEKGYILPGLGDSGDRFFGTL